MDMLKSVLSPFGASSGGIQDTLKLVVIGGTVETARRASMSAWNGFVDSFFLTAHFSSHDYPYDWLMHWLAKQPAWGRSREFEITTRSVGRHGLTQSTTGDLDDDEDDDPTENGRKKRKVAFMPSIARNNDILKQLVLEAKREYEKDAEHRVHIFMADTSFGGWRWNGARQKRPMSSIVLQPGVKDMLLTDCKDFLASEDWYAERGIPFRRGYLLHGVPGSGKTSLIHSLAGELGLDIYVVSLSAKGMSDNTLTTLMGGVPTRCILLLEDLDAAFTKGVSRDANSTGAPTAKTKEAAAEDDGSTLSLSGLLNSLDGVAAAEGRLLFATTNHIERLDPALSRPGRMDVWVNFTHATQYQAEGIFKCFFPSKPPVSSAAVSPSSSSSSLMEDGSQNLPLPKAKSPARVVPLLEEAEIAELAKRFAAAIPENELSVASLQGYLLKNKTRPRECVDEVGAWVIDERETREKLKKEKAEREAKEKKEALELERKEKEEKKAEQLKEAKEKQDRKDLRAKAKKLIRSEAALKSEASNTSSSSDESSSAGSKGTSGSGTDNNTGSEADVEDSVTSEAETEGSGSSSPTGEAEIKDAKKEKWVAVKGQTTPSMEA
ncbi:hypothetical protein HWV62_2581 [Athelia sp. TMB]|nr:hypothetical protein HWV62_2581 [Athelia sp. TMB]